jgi:hypothetical protein
MRKLHLLKNAEFDPATENGAGSGKGNNNKKNNEDPKSNLEKLQDGIDAATGLLNDVANIAKNPTNAYNYYSAARNAYKLVYASGEAYQEQMSATGSVTYTGTAGIPITIKNTEKGKGNNKKGM